MIANQETQIGIANVPIFAGQKNTALKK